MPVVTQYASPDLIDRIAYHQHDPADDPAWTTTGAPSQRTYGRWCRHMCGMACLRMVLLHRDGQAPNLFQLLAGARRYGAYVRQDDEIRGLIYRPFATYVHETHDLSADVHGEMALHHLVQELRAGRMVMASVSKEIRHPEHDPERRGGHLVLAIGLRDGEIVFRNPSGHTPEARSAALPTDRFGAFFGGRGIAIAPHRAGRRGAARTAAAHPVASRTTT
ncbi:C39 family peptidase [Streptomyces olivaceoviridis]|uniref:C39 family peptidase n=1 Tax=Streptomyces olivaceoviridis TaxID=1921 RepID=UPI0036ABF8D0